MVTNCRPPDADSPPPLAKPNRPPGPAGERETELFSYVPPYFVFYLIDSAERNETGSLRFGRNCRECMTTTPDDPVDNSPEIRRSVECNPNPIHLSPGVLTNIQRRWDDMSVLVTIIIEEKIPCKRSFDSSIERQILAGNGLKAPPYAIPGLPESRRARRARQWTRVWDSSSQSCRNIDRNPLHRVIG